MSAQASDVSMDALSGAAAAVVTRAAESQSLKEESTHQLSGVAGKALKGAAKAVAQHEDNTHVQASGARASPSDLEHTIQSD